MAEAAAREREAEGEMLLDRLLLIRSGLAPGHYVRRNPFSFAQICWEFFLFSRASIIRAGNRISLWLYYGSPANVSPLCAANAGGLDSSWPFVNLCPPTMNTTTAALWNNAAAAQPWRPRRIRFVWAAHEHASLVPVIEGATRRSVLLRWKRREETNEHEANEVRIWRFGLRWRKVLISAGLRKSQGLGRKLQTDFYSLKY